MARSLGARRYSVAPAQATILWLRYLYAATANDPGHLMLRHQDFFDDLDHTIDRLVAHLRLAAPDEAARARVRVALDPTLRHHQASATRSAGAPLDELAERVWNGGQADLAAVPEEVASAFAQGWLRGPARRRGPRTGAGGRDPPQGTGQGAQRRLELGAMTTAPTDDASLEAVPGPGEVDPDPDAPVLALPSELVLDEAAYLRLERQLASAPDEMLGVVAAQVELPPGSSARVRAERAAMAPMTKVTEAAGGVFDGAVLLRPGAGFELAATSVRVHDGPLLIDRGAVAHDPWRLQPNLEVASPDGRPPFRWRPVVLLLGLETDLDLAETARGIANGLLARDVEARLAVPEVPEGFYLTRPCRPVAETVQALDPDVVIALDQSALGGRLDVVRHQPVDHGHRADPGHHLRRPARLVAHRRRPRPSAGPRRAGASPAPSWPSWSTASAPGPSPCLRHGRSRPTAVTPSESIVSLPSGERAVGPGREAAPSSPSARPQARRRPPTCRRSWESSVWPVARSTVARSHRSTQDASRTAPLVVVSSSAGRRRRSRRSVERRAGRNRPTLLDLEPTDAVEITAGDGRGWSCVLTSTPCASPGSR